MSASFRTSFLLAICTLVISALGCKQDEIAKPINSSPDESTPAVAAKPETNTVPPSGSATPSPAAADETAFDQTPEGVCQKFMEFLQADDWLSAENLLTRTATAYISKAGVKLQALGGPKSSFKIGDVMYATNLKKLAQVGCTIVDDQDSEAVMDVTWQVRRRGKAWRISGVVLELEPGSGPDLLSFENPVDVAQIQSLAGGEVLDGDEPTRQAKLPEQGSIK
jgi:hypothetical protein